MGIWSLPPIVKYLGACLFLVATGFCFWLLVEDADPIVPLGGPMVLSENSLMVGRHQWTTTLHKKAEVVRKATNLKDLVVPGAQYWTSDVLKRRKAVRSGLIAVHAVLEELGVLHIFTDETALGLYRDGDVVPHDDDVHVIVPIAELGRIVTALSNRVLIVDWRWHTAKVFMTAPVDICGYIVVKGGYCIAEYNNFLNYTAAFPPVSAVFPEVHPTMQFPIPRHAESYLSAGYGSRWTDPSTRKRQDAALGDSWKFCQKAVDQYLFNSGGFDGRRQHPAWLRFPSFFCCIVGAILVLASYWCSSIAAVMQAGGLVLLYCLFVLSWTYATNYTSLFGGEYGTPKILALAQLTQLAGNLLIWSVFDGGFGKLVSTIHTQWSALRWYIIPVLMYSSSDVLCSIVAPHIDGLTFEMMRHMQLVPLVLLTGRYLNRRFSNTAWMAFAFVCCGSLLRQFVHASGTTFYADTVGSLLLGLTLVITPFAWIQHERLLKDSESVPVSGQNIVVNVLSLVCVFFAFGLKEIFVDGPQMSSLLDFSEWKALLLLVQWNSFVCFELLAHTLLCITRSYCLRRLSAVSTQMTSTGAALILMPASIMRFQSLSVAVDIIFAGSIGFGAAAYLYSVVREPRKDSTSLHDASFPVADVPSPNLCGSSMHNRNSHATQSL